MNTSTIGPNPAPTRVSALVPVADAPTAPSAPSRMSLANTRDGIISSPMRILIYGSEKIGKSTFAAGAPSPIWLGADGGTDHLNIRRLPQPETLAEVLEALHEVAKNGHAANIQTLVVDPLNWFEPIVDSDVVGTSGKTLASWDGGYGRGASAAMDRWRLIKKGMEDVWHAGLNVIICAHAAVKKFEDPEGPGYERWELAMSTKPAGLFKQWVDAILFARPDTFGRVDQQKKVKASGTDLRLLYTRHAPAFDAGNRWRLPPELPLSWAAFINAKTKGEEELRTLHAQIDADLAAIKDPDVEKRVRELLSDPNKDVAEVAAAVAEKRKSK